MNPPRGVGSTLLCLCFRGVALHVYVCLFEWTPSLFRSQSSHGLVWAWHANAYALIALQIALAGLNFRGVYKNDQSSSGSEA
jgi:hypothetical protein